MPGKSHQKLRYYKWIGPYERKSPLRKSRGILCKGNQSEDYRFIEQHYVEFGLRWLLLCFHIYPNTYYNYRKQRKPKYKKGKPHKVFENKIQQNFTADAIHPRWCIDFTYLFLKDHEVRYDCTIIDLHDRSVVVSITDRYIISYLVIRTLQKTLESQLSLKGKLILHSD